jgi:hypothetical protein
MLYEDVDLSACVSVEGGNDQSQTLVRHKCELVFAMARISSMEERAKSVEQASGRSRDIRVEEASQY